MTLSRRAIVFTGSGIAGAAAFGAGRRAKAQSQTIRIGVIYGLSGAGALVGEAMLQGTKVAAEIYNRNGGLLGRQIELVIRDDKFNASAGATVLQELTGNGLNLIIGGSQTVTALASLPLLKELKTVLVSPAAAGLSFTHEDFTRYAFRTVASVYVQYGAMARAVASANPAVGKWAGITTDTAIGHDLVNVFNDNVKRRFAELNNGAKAKIVDPIFVSLTQADFRSEINKLAATDAEGIFCGIVGAPEVSFWHQARAVGYDRRLKALAETGGEQVAKQLGSSTPSGLWGPVYWPYTEEPYKSSMLSKELYDGCVAATGDKWPPMLTQLGFRAGQAMFEGIRKAGSTETEPVIAALEGLEFQAISGPYRIRKEDHQGIGTAQFGLFDGPSAGAPWTLRKLESVQEADLVEPPSPGKAFRI